MTRFELDTQRELLELPPAVDALIDVFRWWDTDDFADMTLGEWSVFRHAKEKAIGAQPELDEDEAGRLVDAVRLMTSEGPSATWSGERAMNAILDARIQGIDGDELLETAAEAYWPGHTEWLQQQQGRPQFYGETRRTPEEFVGQMRHLTFLLDEVLEPYWEQQT